MNIFTGYLDDFDFFKILVGRDKASFLMDLLRYSNAITALRHYRYYVNSCVWLNLKVVVSFTIASSLLFSNPLMSAVFLLAAAFELHF